MKKFINTRINKIGVKAIIPTILIFKHYVTLQIWNIEIVVCLRNNYE